MSRVGVPAWGRALAGCGVVAGMAGLLVLLLASPATADNCDLRINPGDCQNTAWVVGVTATAAAALAVAAVAGLTSQPPGAGQAEENDPVAAQLDSCEPATIPEREVESLARFLVRGAVAAWRRTPADLRPEELAVLGQALAAAGVPWPVPGVPACAGGRLTTACAEAVLVAVRHGRLGGVDADRLVGLTYQVGAAARPDRPAREFAGLPLLVMRATAGVPVRDPATGREVWAGIDDARRRGAWRSDFRAALVNRLRELAYGERMALARQHLSATPPHLPQPVHHGADPASATGRAGSRFAEAAFHAMAPSLRSRFGCAAYVEHTDNVIVRVTERLDPFLAGSD